MLDECLKMIYGEPVYCPGTTTPVYLWRAPQGVIFFFFLDCHLEHAIKNDVLCPKFLFIFLSSLYLLSLPSSLTSHLGASPDLHASLWPRILAFELSFFFFFFTSLWYLSPSSSSPRSPSPSSPSPAYLTSAHLVPAYLALAHLAPSPCILSRIYSCLNLATHNNVPMLYITKKKNHTMAIIHYL